MTEQDMAKIISNLAQKSSENNLPTSVPSAYIFTTETQPTESRHLTYSETD